MKKIGRAELLAASERDKYSFVWAMHADYGSPSNSVRLWNDYGYVVDHKRMHYMLDIGCGRGDLIKLWQSQGRSAFGVDIAANAPAPDIMHRVTIQPIWDLCLGTVREFDCGVCADVLEHIPPSMIEQSLVAMSRQCKMLLIKVANYSSVVGHQELHLTQQPLQWWENQLHDFCGEVIFSRRNAAKEEYIFAVICRSRPASK